jgi:hypothetical protein
LRGAVALFSSPYREAGVIQSGGGTMALDFATAERDLVAELNRRGLTMSSTAMDPLRAVDFKALARLPSHEERFLRDQFVSSLLAAHHASGSREITSDDMLAAMSMLVRAVESADPQLFSPASRQILYDACPYCD